MKDQSSTCCEGSNRVCQGSDGGLRAAFSEPFLDALPAQLSNVDLTDEKLSERSWSSPKFALCVPLLLFN
jgi:hypothetical protein